MNGSDAGLAVTFASKLWYLYIIQSESTGKLYTGITTEPARRIQEHNGKNNKGAKYTRTGRPWKIVYLEPQAGRVEAMKRERAVKKLSRQAKLRLVATQSSI